MSVRRISNAAAGCLLVLATTTACRAEDAAPQEAPPAAGTPSTGIDGSGLLMASCDTDGVQLTLLDPGTGSPSARLAVPRAMNSDTAGIVSSALTCKRDTAGTYSDDWRYVVAQGQDNFGTSHHVGVMDLRDGGFLDVTALTEPTGFSAVSAYDQEPWLNGTVLSWVRNRSEIWRYDLASGRAEQLPGVPDLEPKTSDQVIEYSADGTHGASARCPVGDCDTGGNLFVFPAMPPDDSVVQALELTGHEGTTVSVGPWVDDRRLILGDGSGQVIEITDLAEHLSPAGSNVAATDVTPLIPPNNHLNYDVTPAPDGSAVAFLSRDDTGTVTAYQAPTDGSRRLTEVPVGAAVAAGATGMPRLVSWR
ncbi:hypothetical protein [Symbioplanes lichenis]|uniref:hypothetical protein n=1 Tax=Symbioplanes lichenis TaxID=1629072 RepID=UPI002738D34A|nr:hypothetical protein [Actinoplanes lichenis]